MSYQVNWEIQALDLTAGFLSDDPAGIAALLERVSHLADEPRPPESFPYRPPDLRRLRAAGTACPDLTLTTSAAEQPTTAAHGAA